MSRPRWWDWLAFALIVVPTLTRALTTVLPNLYFAQDPTLSPPTFDGLGPAGAMTLDLLAMAGAVLALVGAARSERGVEWAVGLLAALPAVAIAYHGWDDPDSMRVGVRWLAGAGVAVGAVHLSRHPRLRVLMAAVVLALAAPLVTKALYQMTVEHRITLEEFQENRESILASQGWEPGSPGALIYERRLVQNEATGFFALSNVLGSVLAGLASFWVAMTLAGARSRLSSGWIGLIGLVAIACLAGVAMTRSKGAIGAAVLGVVLAGSVLLPRRWRRRVQPYTMWIPFGLIGLVLLAVVVRGAALGEPFTADGYSLLFRWHYWQGAWRAFWDRPIFGVGPDGFKAAYMMVKPPESPEEVTTPHSVFMAWLSMLGVFGLSWVALVAMLVRGASPASVPRRAISGDNGEPLDLAPGDPDDGEEHWHATRLPAIGLGLTVLLLTWWLNRESMLPDFQWLLWPLSMAGWTVLTAALPWLVGQTWWGLLRWAVWAALTTVLVHSQIEMTMTTPGSAPLVWLLLGSAWVAPQRRDEGIARRRRFVEWAVVAAWAGLLVWIGVAGWRPTLAQQAHLKDAATILGDVGRAGRLLGQALAPDRYKSEALDRLEATAERLKLLGVDPRVDGRLREARSAALANDSARVNSLMREVIGGLRDGIVRLEVERTPAALEALVAAYTALPTDVEPLREAAKRWVSLARAQHRSGEVELAHAAFEQAAAIVERMAQQRPDDGSVRSFAAAVLLAWLDATGSEEAALLDRAIEHQAAAVDLDPHGLTNTVRLAELLDRADRTEAATAAYRRALEIDENLRLDPLKRLPDERREAIERHVGTAGG